MKSLRRQLLTWLLPSTLCAAALGSVGTYWSAAFELSNMLDDQLRYVAQHVQADAGHLSVDQRNVYHQRLTDESVDEVLVELWQRDALRYSSDISLRLSPPRGEGFGDIDRQGQVWHTFVLHRGDTVVRVAQARDERWEALARIAAQLVWPIAATLPLLGLSLWFGIGRGLLPLQRIARELSTRDAQSMSPVAADRLPAEVQPMVDAMNQMLGRLGAAFEQQRAFVADAAHELRTPIMAISIQAGLADGAATLAERQQAISEVRIGADRLGRLADQLLTLARLEPGGAQPVLQSTDLLDTCKTVVLDSVCTAEARGIDLGVGSGELVVVVSDPALLHLLLRNLVDNAIRYTSPGGRVDVSIRRGPGRATVSVEDDGPGIPEQDRDRVFDRFYRGCQQRVEPGSGLGLAIVKRIADSLGGEVRIGSGQNGLGTRVDVTLPTRVADE